MEFLEPDEAILRNREKWRYRGQTRPDFAIEPKVGQESVWDYPRPPRIVPDSRLVEVRHGDLLVASSRDAIRVLETASPPTFYLPPADVVMSRLHASGATSRCEWKGQAIDLELIGRVDSVGWTYPRVFPEFESIMGWVSFYPSAIDCFVDGERVRPQPGGYYGGWITREIVGPFKGESVLS